MATHQFEFAGTDLCDMARRLIANGTAREDRIEMLRRGKLAFSGQVGWCADHTVRDTPTEGPIFVKWKPFPVERRPPKTAKKVWEVSSAKPS